MSRDRRIQHRIPIDHRLNEFFLLPHRNQSEVGIGKDLGTGGMCILTSKALNPGQTVQISLSLPDQETAFRCDAVVKWVKKDSQAFLTGVQFLDLSLREKKQIQALVNQSRREPFFVRWFSFLKKP